MKTRILIMLLVSIFCISCYTGQSIKRGNGWYYIYDRKKDSISKEAIVTVKDFIALKLDSDALGNFVILGTISKHKQNEWGDATEKSIGKRIGFLFDNEIITDPQVNARIPNGHFSISAPHGHDLKSLFYKMRQENDTLFANSQSYHRFGQVDIAIYKRLEEALLQELKKPNISNRAIDYMMSDAYREYKSYIGEHPDYIGFLFQSFLFQESVKGLYGLLIDDIVKAHYPEASSIWKMAIDRGNQDDETSIVLEYQKRVRRLMNKEKNKEMIQPDSMEVSFNFPDNKLLWEEANRYRATITDSTFLKIKGNSSGQFLDPLVARGWNRNYAYNQVVYLKALERAKRHLVIKDNQFICSLKSGKEIRISEDLYRYICCLFDDWSRWVAEGRFKIAKDENGLYNVVPNKQR